MEKNNFQSAFDAGVNLEPKKIDIEGVPHVYIPSGTSLANYECLLDQPKRIRAHPQFYDIEGFLNYFNEFKRPGTKIFVDDNNYTITAIFDYHHEKNPHWCEHTASMFFQKSHEWENFTNFDEKRLTPLHFSEFLEDHIDFLGEAQANETTCLNASDLLTMAQSLKIELKGGVEIQESLHKGVTKISIDSEHILQGRCSGGAEISFPEKLNFSLRVFKNHKTYGIEVYLRYRVVKDNLFFFIKMPCLDRLMENAFNSILEDLKKDISIPILKGKPPIKMP